MRIGICSGYFQRFHFGHRAYLRTAIQMCDMVVVIINNEQQQRRKYLGFEKIKSFQEISKEIKSIFPNVLITESIDTDGSVCKTIEAIAAVYDTDSIVFCKDADRNINNIPEKETLDRLGIGLLQFSNPKINSSSKIMREETC